MSDRLSTPPPQRRTAPARCIGSATSRRRPSSPGASIVGLWPRPDNGSSAACRIVRRMPTRQETLQIDGRDVVITNPDKVFFPETGHTKLDLVRYYLAVAEGALCGAGGRPMALKR